MILPCALLKRVPAPLIRIGHSEVWGTFNEPKKARAIPLAVAKSYSFSSLTKIQATGACEKTTMHLVSNILDNPSKTYSK